MPHGKVTDFYGAVKCEEGENVVFSWIVYRNRKARDRVNKAVLADLAAAPDTNLNLTLLGILSNGSNDKDSRSRALISAQGGEEKPYSVGDDVSRGVQLTAIFPDRVILNRNGKLETLRLDKESTSGLTGSPITQSSPPMGRRTSTRRDCWSPTLTRRVS